MFEDYFWVNIRYVKLSKVYKKETMSQTVLIVNVYIQ